MSNTEGNGTPAFDGRAPKSGFWQRLKRVLIHTEAEFSFLKGLTFVGFLSTLIVAYFQYLSAYQDKVATQAKDDLESATAAFKEASTALSVPLSLQERLISGYYDAIDQKIDTDANAYLTRSMRAINGPYQDAYTALRQNINLLAQSVEIYLDWASDANRDPAINIPPTADPISVSALGTYNFDCDNDMPIFTENGYKLVLKGQDGTELDVDWYSVKHHILTIYYCFYLTHELMEPAREWASSSPVDTNGKGKFIERKKLLTGRLTKQIVRANAFMGLALNEIEQIRVKYRPNGFWCSVPGVREALGQRCTPVRVASE